MTHNESDLNGAYRIPILLLVYNRPELTRRVINSLKHLKPKFLFIAADGPLPGSVADAEMCNIVRELVHDVDWDCELTTRFSDVHFGCRIAVSTAISWFFKNVEKGIILEDDCQPNFTFFSYMDELLNRYQTYSKVMAINGVNFEFDSRICNMANSYYFSRYVHVWGWASWRRAWQHYDVQMKTWPKAKHNGLLNRMFDNENSINYWSDLFDRTYNNQIDTWDYQWLFTIWEKKGLAITPRANLISNIGFNETATHTKNAKSPFAAMNTKEMQFPMLHPNTIVRNKEADSREQFEIFERKTTDHRSSSKLKRLPQVIKSKTKRILQKVSKV